MSDGGARREKTVSGREREAAAQFRSKRIGSRLCQPSAAIRTSDKSSEVRTGAFVPLGVLEFLKSHVCKHAGDGS